MRSANRPTFTVFFQISSIHQNAFYNAPSIVMIDLSDNQLFDLPPSTFLAQLNLQMIDLRNNKIIRTPYAAFNRRVGTVFLQGIGVNLQCHTWYHRRLLQKIHWCAPKRFTCSRMEWQYSSLRITI